VEDTFSAVFLDYDNDGDLDIYATYDHRIGNDLWRNDGPGCGGWCFTNVSESAGADAEVEGMGLAVADYDSDGDLDIYTTSLLPVAVLLQNQTSQGSPTFVDVTIPAGLVVNAVGWGTAFFDYDNDGWLDLYTATSNAEPGKTNLMYHNEGNETFTNVSEESGASNASPTYGVAYADYDNDGWVDFLIGNLGEQYHLYRNLGTAGAGNHWIDLKLVGGGDVNHDAVGARAYVYTSDGRTQLQEVKCGSSQGCGNQLRLHFGLGTASVDSVCVVWPNGVRECRYNVTTDQTTTWYYGSVSAASDGRLGGAIRLYPIAPNPFNPVTTIEFELTRAGEVVLQIYDIRGRAIRTLVNEVLPTGRHRATWRGVGDSGEPVASGVYFCRLTTDEAAATRKMVLLK
jgi:hypothetical protein